MKSVGIFEAKTHFPRMCDEIVASGTPVMISRRGKPLVVISPVPTESQSEREDILLLPHRVGKRSQELKTPTSPMYGKSEVHAPTTRSMRPHEMASRYLGLFTAVEKIS